MDYHTPGVYIREVDSGPKPIASVSTSIPGFLGLFEFRPAHDAPLMLQAPDTEAASNSSAPEALSS